MRAALLKEKGYNHDRVYQEPFNDPKVNLWIEAKLQKYLQSLNKLDSLMPQVHMIGGN